MESLIEALVKAAEKAVNIAERTRLLKPTKPTTKAVKTPAPKKPSKHPLEAAIEREWFMKLEDIVRSRIGTVREVTELEKKGVVRVLVIGRDTWVISTKRAEELKKKLSEQVVTEENAEFVLSDKEYKLLELLALAGEVYVDENGRYMAGE